MKLRVLAVGLAVLVMVAAGAAPAWAHASLVSSTPTDGARLAELPARVTFTFSEDVAEPAYVVVRAADGASVTSGEPVVDGATVTQDLDGSGTSGDISLAFRVVSVDGHPVTGELGFTVTGAKSGTTGGEDGEAKDGGAAAGAGDAVAPAGPDPTPGTAAGTAPTAADPDAGHWSRHWSHYVIGGGLIVVAGALVLTSRSREG